MFENKTKPELERGNYLVYTDEPDTVYDSPGGGGGGGVSPFEISFDKGDVTCNFTYNDLVNSISGNQFVFAVAEKMPATPPSTDIGYGVFILYFAGTDGVDGYSASFISGSSITVMFTSSDPDAVMEYTV